jgi:hypothetical protein
MGNREKMVQHAIDIAEDDSHGYSWADRWNVDRDCATLMYDSADAAGYPVGRGPDRVRYTGTMIDDFTAAGFKLHNYDSFEEYRGCILLRDPWGEGGHTEMYIGDGMTVGAHIAETGGVYGEPGDQTGNEISIAPNPEWWDYILEPPADEEEPVPQPIQDPGEPVNGEGLYYRAHVQNIGWCGAVRDGQTAGTTGYGLRLEALKCKPPRGWKVEFGLHVQNRGWLRYVCDGDSPNSGDGSSEGDPIMGTVGEALRVEDFMVRVLKRPENASGKRLWFRVHQQNVGWKGWTEEGFASGTDGMELRLEAIQMKIV